MQAARIFTSSRPLRVGLLSNPGSGRNRNNLHSIYRILAQHPQVSHRQAQTPAHVAAALDEFATRELDVLAINGGDGTVQAVLTVLMYRKPFGKLPLLALLPGGTTNMTAGDVGLKGNRNKALGKLLAWAAVAHAGVHLLQRPVMCIQPAPDRAPLYGMFFGAGAIIKGIEYCHNKVHPTGLRDGLAPGLCTLRVLLAMARGDPDYVTPVPMAIEMRPKDLAPHWFQHKQHLLLLLASTLERLFLGIHPYWGTPSGALYCTAIRTRPARAWRALPPLFWGHPNRLGTPENGYWSHKVNELRLTMDSRFTLDGELYEAHSRFGPVRVSQGGQVTFIRL
jgi:diacylglycerol kinase (ATP)